MNGTEHERLDVANFQDVVQDLPDDEGLFMSRNTVRHAKVGLIGEAEDVHYEGIDDVPVGDYRIDGALVTGEFHDVARWVLSDPDYARQGPAYPRITVINNTTGAYVSRIIDVAELIIHDSLPIYSRPEQFPGESEVLYADFMPLIRTLINDVGVQPDRSIVLRGRGAQPLHDIDPSTETRLAQTFEVTEDVEAVYAVKPRGEAALNLLQMDTAQAFMASSYRRRDTYPGSVEVVLQVGTKPDLQTLLLAMIDVIELRGERLYLYKDIVATGEIGFVLTIVDNEFRLVEELSRESSLDIAIYNAYRAAWGKFSEEAN